MFQRRSHRHGTRLLERRKIQYGRTTQLGRTYVLPPRPLAYSAGRGQSISYPKFHSLSTVAREDQMHPQKLSQEPRTHADQITPPTSATDSGILSLCSGRFQVRPQPVYILVASEWSQLGCLKGTYACLNTSRLSQYFFLSLFMSPQNYSHFASIHLVMLCRPITSAYCTCMITFNLYLYFFESHVVVCLFFSVSRLGNNLTISHVMEQCYVSLSASYWRSLDKQQPKWAIKSTIDWWCAL